MWRETALQRLQKIRHHRPDVVTLDVEMPGLDGLEVLQAIQKEGIDTRVIMVSSHTERGATTTTKALELGAFDFILKPNDGDYESNAQALERQLSSRIEILRKRLSVATSGTDVARRTATPIKSSVATVKPREIRSGNRAPTLTGLDAICIGISTGGPKALAEMLPALHARLDIPES